MDTRQTLESNLSSSIEAVSLEATPHTLDDDQHSQLLSYRIKQRFFRPSAPVLFAMLVGSILLLFALLPSLFPPALVPLKDSISIVLYLILALFLVLLAFQIRQTHRKLIAEQRRLFTAEERLRIALRNSFITVYQQDKDLRYTWMANPLRAFNAKDVVGKTDADFVAPDEAAHLSDIKRHVLQTGESIMEEVRTTSSMGVRFAELRVEPLRNSKGIIVGVTGTAIDITERKQVEEERSNLERERLLMERSEAEAKAQAAQASKRLMEEFLSVAGHELRTPLTTIKASVQLAKRQLIRVQTYTDTFSTHALMLVNNAKQLLERAERQANIQSRLVDDLLDISRIQVGQLDIHPEQRDIVALVKQVVEDQQDDHFRRTINVETPIDKEILVRADTDRVRQVLSNYLSNALKYSAPSTTVTVRVERVVHEPDEQVCVSVCDEGPGLSEEQVQHIWEQFYRVPGIEVKSGSGVGLGLGLYVSRNLIERQGGTVGVQSKPEQGSTFWFTLPVLSHNKFS